MSGRLDACRSQSVRGAMSDPSVREHAARILAEVMKHRRSPARCACKGALCSDACVRPHLDRVARAVERAQPIVFILPSFPGKSPNPAKVLGPMPDMAERASLTFLNTLCRKIGERHAPGARLILCSDGRVFSDAVGLHEPDVTAYQRGIESIIEELRLEALSTFNLDDLFPGCDFAEMRSRLMARHGRPLDDLRAAVRAGGEARQIYCGITRFLFEDALRPDLGISRTALQKLCRERAYHVVQRSKAWDGLLAGEFPDAVRLSIHPQGCGSGKIGIHMMATADEWLTPWHGVAALANGSFTLIKRREAEAAGARMVFRDGRPSHYVLRAASPRDPTGAVCGAKEPK
ncbi:isocyanide synthase family protein [Lysobacter yananisis]|uniref:Isocyanide synthase family protein n=2 Tax=Lysobacter yananisis TaxID=1003114 RepID=A0ABY9PFL2_9GAMM|nr:isocyanide synthase family protein [Lysobacter yananisis]WMT05006.1 isocyanide synthase family protein [Lysobacter yananisis]